MRGAQGLIDDRQALAQAVLDKVSSAWDNLQEYPAGALTVALSASVCGARWYIVPPCFALMRA